MMQLDEMARQASTDVKLAVMDLEAPPIGATAKSQRKATAGWAKPLVAMAALFLIAGTSWVLLGGNKDVEETQIADLDVEIDAEEADVVPLVHPEGIDPSIEALTPSSSNRYEPFVVFSADATDAGAAGFFVASIWEDFAPSPEEADEMFPGTEVRGLPTSSISDQDGIVAMWVEPSGDVVMAGTTNMTTEALLVELQHPDLLSGTVADDSDFVYLGSSGFDPSTPNSGGLNGFTSTFAVPVPELRSSTFRVSSFVGSLENELAVSTYAASAAPIEVQVRPGVTGYLLAAKEPGNVRPQLMWEESPGVVAVLYQDYDDPEPVAGEKLVDIAAELVPGGEVRQEVEFSVSEVADFELSEAEASSSAWQRIEELRESPTENLLEFRLFNDGAAADIFYEIDGGREICVETVGLGVPVQCFTAEASPPAAYLIRTSGDDLDSGERSVLVVMYGPEFRSTFSSSDPLLRSDLTSGMELIVGSTYDEAPVLELQAEDGDILETLIPR